MECLDVFVFDQWVDASEGQRVRNRPYLRGVTICGSQYGSMRSIIVTPNLSYCDSTSLNWRQQAPYTLPWGR